MGWMALMALMRPKLQMPRYFDHSDCVTFELAINRAPQAGTPGGNGGE